ncbi:MAG: adenylyltransferase/cytidyltransferase family protein [Candidatus Altiarchaeota archaeon]|nr:adenylyltransferase/cytidyltransferase family protein [Candidatus Altiarchaeota archaeon]
MVRVVATGVFSIIHPGHIIFLKEARKLGDELVVVVARDKTVGLRKGSQYIPEEQRLHVVSALKMVDKAVLGDEEDIYKPMKDLKPDIIALGSDQDFDEEKLQSELRNQGLNAKLVRIKRYYKGELYSTRRIIDRIKNSKKID